MTECTEHCVVLQNGRSVMLHAAWKGHFEVVEKLAAAVAAAGGDMNVQDKVRVVCFGDEGCC